MSCLISVSGSNLLDMTHHDHFRVEMYPDDLPVTSRQMPAALRFIAVSEMDSESQFFSQITNFFNDLQEIVGEGRGAVDHLIYVYNVIIQSLL